MSNFDYDKFINDVPEEKSSKESQRNSSRLLDDLDDLLKKEKLDDQDNIVPTVSKQIDSLKEDDSVVSELKHNEGFELTVLTVRNFKTARKYFCIILADGKVLSEKQLPIFYHKDLSFQIEKIAGILNGKALRGDKTLEKLIKLGFTDQHKVFVASKAKKNQHNKLGSVEDMKANFSSDIQLEKKYIVLPLKYFDKIPKNIYEDFFMALSLLEDSINEIRIKTEKKKPLAASNYFVVNQDEPYANLIWQRIVAGEKLKIKQLLKQQKEDKENGED